MANTRNIALNVLLKIENEGAYSNIALNNAIKENRLSGVDSSFVSALVYGVLEKKSGDTIVTAEVYPNFDAIHEKFGKELSQEN